MPRTFTRDGLRKFNGKDGKSAYVAFKGKVYDITKSSFWDGGDHFGQHEAGMDLTEEIDDAPHGDETLADMPVVGELAG
ncbi:MAG: cytochrome b5 domain-containing protein [Candidatus Humimicrobiaceae bacterium]